MNVLVVLLLQFAKSLQANFLKDDNHDLNSTANIQGKDEGGSYLGNSASPPKTQYLPFSPGAGLEFNVRVVERHSGDTFERKSRGSRGLLCHLYSINCVQERKMHFIYFTMYVYTYT